jgi:hypothetical protein
MKQTAIQKAITMVRSRIESIDETLMGKHTIHHLQQVERDLYDLLEQEKDQMKDAFLNIEYYTPFDSHLAFEEYYKEVYESE